MLFMLCDHRENGMLYLKHIFILLWHYRNIIGDDIFDVAQSLSFIHLLLLPLYIDFLYCI